MDLGHIYEIAFFAVFVTLLVIYVKPQIQNVVYKYEIKRAKALTEQAEALEKLQLETYRTQHHHDTLVNDMNHIRDRLSIWKKNQLLQAEERHEAEIDSYITAKQREIQLHKQRRHEEIARIHFAEVVKDISKSTSRVSFDGPMAAIAKLYQK